MHSSMVMRRTLAFAFGIFCFQGYITAPTNAYVNTPRVTRPNRPAILHQQNIRRNTVRCRSLPPRERPSDRWDGDDLRFVSRIRRRLRRSYGPVRVQPISSTLITANILMFTYQVVNTVQWIARRYPQHWPGQAFAVLWDALMGSTSPGPLTRDFFYTTVLAQRQPHRYLTAGFLHGGIIHLLLNMESLRRLPTWLETGLGGGVYLTTFLASIVAGNLGHTFLAADGMTAGAACLGASGGICGLYGLLFVALSKMGSQRAASQVLWGMGRIILYGILLTNVSNASHIAGFGAGIVMGLLLAPTYRKSYGARRKNSLEVDVHSRDYRTAMGFGIEPSTRGGLVPLSLVWLAAAACVVVIPRFRSAPRLVLRGLMKPGTLTSFWL